jgi:hypothetical protein
VFAGNENDRTQVRQFTGLLRHIAIDADCAVLLASHPSVSGMKKGSGLSGSTAWHNSVRTRLYFKEANANGNNSKADHDLRELECMKSNYGPSGEVVRLHWDNGVFKPIGGTVEPGAFGRREKGRGPVPGVARPVQPPRPARQSISIVNGVSDPTSRAAPWGGFNRKLVYEQLGLA